MKRRSSDRIARVTALMAGIFMFASFPIAAIGGVIDENDQSSSEFTVQGWTGEYGLADGLTIDSQVIDVGTPNLLGIQPFSSGTTTFTRGASYVSTRHPHSDHLRYFGKAYAHGNLYNGEYVIVARFKYSRGGSDVSSWKSSLAVQNANCSWSPGKVVEHAVWDSPLGGANNVTRFHYDFVTAPKNMC